jgi:hypothetical protein
MKIFNSFMKKLWLPIVLGTSLVWGVQSAQAEGTGTDPQSISGSTEEGQAIKKSPTFEEADKNGDHYVTKDELEDDPFLLKHFDMVDAGKDGKLEEHEYENLIMEKRRERGM